MSKKLKWTYLNLKEKKFNDKVKIKLIGKRIYPIARVWWIGVKTDQCLSWQRHINDLSVKLNKANPLLFKIREFVDDKRSRSICFAIFESNLNYCSFVWAQSHNAINRLVLLQEKYLKLWTFNFKILIPVLYLEKRLS